MSLDIHLTAIRPTEVFHANITHNLAKMAREAWIFDYLWHPETSGFAKAEQLIQPLEQALVLMRANSAHFKQFDAPNGWGTYDDFVPWIERLLEACRENPDAEISVSR